MVSKIRWGFITTLLILAGLLLFWRTTFAQVGRADFPETGHTIGAEFLDAYWSADDPFLVYGYPITDAIYDSTTVKLIQYFQRARFELHPERPPDQRVQISPLGEFIYQYEPGSQLELPDNFPACRIFFDTGFQVCYAFLEFFDANGGVEQFGSPISGFELHNERIVQYFQKARFEWHPERPPGQRVKLADLGREYFFIRAEDPRWLESNNTPTILDLRVRAYPEVAVTSQKDSQTIYVVVRDQNWIPVPGAQVKLFIQLPSGEEEQYVATPTDEHGIAKHTFSFETGSTGLTNIIAVVKLGSLEDQTRTSFRIWW